MLCVAECWVQQGHGEPEDVALKLAGPVRSGEGWQSYQAGRCGWGTPGHTERREGCAS